MTHVTCRLTAKNPDQLRNPTLSNRVWATFTFFYISFECMFLLCIGLVFPVPSQEIGLGNVSEMTYFVSSGTRVALSWWEAFIVGH